jgi:hypothetical protein
MTFMTRPTTSSGAPYRPGRRHVLGLVGSALIVGLAGGRRAAGQGAAPAITVHKSPT